MLELQQVLFYMNLVSSIFNVTFFMLYLYNKYLDVKDINRLQFYYID